MKKLFKKNGLELCEIGIKKSVLPFSYQLRRTITWQYFFETNALLQPTQNVQIPTYRSFILFGLELYIELKIYKYKTKQDVTITQQEKIGENYLTINGSKLFY